MEEHEDPYAVPRAELDGVSAALSEQARLRQEHIANEGSLRNLGLFAALCGGGLIVWTLGAVILDGGTAWAPGSSDSSAILVGILALPLSAAGVGLWRLAPWSRRLSVAMACAFGVVAAYHFELFGLVVFYPITLLCSEDARTIFSPRYAEAIAATPDLRAETTSTTWLWTFGLVFLMAGAALTGVLMAMLAG